MPFLAHWVLDRGPQFRLRVAECALPMPLARNPAQWAAAMSPNALRAPAQCGQSRLGVPQTLLGATAYVAVVELPVGRRESRCGFDLGPARACKPIGAEPPHRLSDTFLGSMVV